MPSLRGSLRLLMLLGILLTHTLSYPRYSSKSSLSKLACPSNCKKCGGIFKDICTSCHPGEYLSSSGTCLSCDESCSLCTGPSSEACTSCKTELYYLIEGRCEKLQRQLQVSNISLPASSFTVTSALTIYYNFNNDTNNTIDIYFVFSNTEWVGLGFGTLMPDSDMIVVEIINNGIVVTDRYATDHTAPPLDTSLGGTNDVILVAYLLNSSMLIAQVNRKQNTGDIYDFTLNGPGAYNMIYATSSSQTMADHNRADGDDNSFVANLIPGSGTTITVNPNFASRSYYMQVHGIMMVIAWGFLAEISSYLPRYFRAWKHYTLVHALISWVIFVCNTVFFAIPIYWDNYLGMGYTIGTPLVVAHFAIGVSLYILACLQHFGGIALAMKLLSYKETERVYDSRRWHMASGMMILCLSKAQLLIGVMTGYPNYTGSMVGYIVFSVGLRIIVEILYRYLVQKKGIQAVEQKNLTSDQVELLKMLTNNSSTSDIKRKLPKIRWLLFGNRVVDVSSFNHPGGNFVMEEVYGREIGRFFYGGYSLEIAKKVRPYKHSRLAMGTLHQLVIGEINFGNSILEYGKGTEQTQNEDSILDMIEKKDDSVSGGRQLWRLVHKEKLTDSISMFSLKSSRFLVKNYVSGVEWMGKHFILQFARGPTVSTVRLYTTVLCMTDDNTKLRKWAIRNFDVLIGKADFNEVKYPSDFATPKLELPLIIKKYRSPNAFSNRLHEANTNRSEDAFIYVEGPVGRGLELSGILKGTYVIFAAGTGILPFLDWLNYYLMKSMLEVLQRKGLKNKDLKEMNVYEENYGKVFDESFEIVLYGSFVNEKEIIGLDILEKLAELGKSHGVKFAASFRGFGSENINKLQEKFGREFLKRNVGMDVERVMICGSPSFNREIVESLRKQGLGREKIQIV